MKKLPYLFCAALLGISTIGSAATQNGSAAKTDQNVFTNQNDEARVQKIVHDYIINNPQVLLEAGKKLQDQEASKEKQQVDRITANIPKYKKEIFDSKDPGRVVLGNPNGKIIIAEFTQYQCPHCKTVSPIVEKFIKNNSDVKLIIIYWPFFGNDAIYASKAAIAAQKQNKFGELHQAMFALQDFMTKEKTETVIKSVAGLDATRLHIDMEAKEIETGIKNNFTLAQKLNLIGTPTFIFTNREMSKFSLIPGQTPDIENDLNNGLKEVR